LKSARTIVDDDPWRDGRTCCESSAAVSGTGILLDGTHVLTALHVIGRVKGGELQLHGLVNLPGGGSRKVARRRRRPRRPRETSSWISIRINQAVLMPINRALRKHLVTAAERPLSVADEERQLRTKNIRRCRWGHR
jgi:hypothetical protein